MKRFFAALLALACMLSLSACREEQAAAKPVIYLYPEEETAVTVPVMVPAIPLMKMVAV